MKVGFRSSFLRDLRRVKDQRTLDKVRYAIGAAERAEALSAIPNLKKMSGTSGFYRIKVGDYRIGIALEGDEVAFVRVLHRREIYRYFP